MTTRPSRAKLATVLALALALLPAPARAEVTNPVPLTFDGQFRARWEQRAGVLTNAVPASEIRRTDAVAMRTRLGVGARVKPRVRLHVQLQDSRTMGEAGTTTGNLDRVDLHQAWAELDSLGGWPASLRVGRQELSYGDQRLVSPLDWSNTGRAWDGVRGRAAWRGFSLDVFHTVVEEKGGAGLDRLFSGLYGSWRGPQGIEADAYHLWRQNQGAPAFGSATYAEDPSAALYERTFGARVRLARGRATATAEGVAQHGRRGSGVDPQVIRAWGVAAKATLALPARQPVRLFAEALLASGDRVPGDGRYETFRPPYPLGHAYLGYMDLVGWSNTASWNAGAVVKPLAALEVEATYHAFAVAEARDALYGTGGGVSRGGGIGRDDDVGTEFDLLVKWAARPGAAVLAGYGRFWAGDFIPDPHPTQDWGFVQLTVGF
jgi:hypothetical protein